MAISDLQQRFGVPGVVQFDEGRGGLPRVIITSPLASAEVYLHGAHLTAFQPAAAKPVLFMSKESNFDPAKPIRGGVPIIFPWFGPKAGSPESPAHGFARIRPWDLLSCTVDPSGAVNLSLSLTTDDCVLRMTFGFSLTLWMELEVTAGPAPLTFEEALHTYFSVGDVRQISVDGLLQVGYIDKVDGFQRKAQGPGPFRFTGETDRVYLDTHRTCWLRDPVLQRVITVEKRESNSTVIWNPWIAKAKAMKDFGDDEWPSMLCIETANVGESAIRLEAGRTHRMSALVTVRDFTAIEK